MKKAIVITVLGLSVLACHRKTAPAADSAKAKEDAAQTAMVTEGKNVYTSNCGRCHGLKTVENYTAERWDGILKSMIPKAKLNETQAQQVTAYVHANAKK